MTDAGHALEHPMEDEAPVNDRAVQVLVWLLMGGILLILLVAILYAAKSLLALVAGATTLFAIVAVVVAVILGIRVLRLEERVQALEQGRRP